MKTLGNERGAVFALVGLALFFLAAIIGFATDYGVVVYVQNQGQAAVDTAALAGASGIPEYRDGGDPSTALSRIGALDLANDVRGRSADIASGATLDFVHYDAESDTFTCESSCDPEDVNAVRVTKTDYQAPFFFSWARSAGASSSTDVRVSAVGYLGCPADEDTGPGGLGPIALRECEISYPDDCNVPRVLQSSGDNSAFTTFNLNGSSVCGQIAREAPPDALQESIHVGDVINLVGTGQATSCLKDIEDRFAHCSAAACATNPPDPTCTLPLPVIDCVGPESNGTVVGFATACIHGVNSHGKDKFIDAEIECGPVDPGPPGGECFGTFAQRPILVR